MALASKIDEDGNVDEQYTPTGRKRLTNRQLREREFMSLARKLRPSMMKALETSLNILNAEKATDANKLKAAALLIGEWKYATDETYNKTYDKDEAVEQPPLAQNPSFSLTVIGDHKKKKSK